MRIFEAWTYSNPDYWQIWFGGTAFGFGIGYMVSMLVRAFTKNGTPK